MGQVVQIGIVNSKGDQIQSVGVVEAIKGKGLLNDRKFEENNQNERQVTLIEIENINHFNKISKTSIPPVDFRRNIITKNIKLNDLLDKEGTKWSIIIVLIIILIAVGVYYLFLR